MSYPELSSDAYDTIASHIANSSGHVAIRNHLLSRLHGLSLEGVNRAEWFFSSALEEGVELNMDLIVSFFKRSVSNLQNKVH